MHNKLYHSAKFEGLPMSLTALQVTYNMNNLLVNFKLCRAFYARVMASVEQADAGPSHFLVTSNQNITTEYSAPQKTMGIIIGTKQTSTKQSCNR